MRLAILTNYHLEQFGGAEEALDRLASYWHHAGHDVTLLSSPSRRTSSRRDWSPAYACQPIRRPLSTRFGLRWYVRPLRRLHRQRPIDLLVASDVYWPGYVARRFWQQFQVPYVLYSHGGDCMHGSRFLERAVCRERMEDAIRDAAGVACISQYVRQRLALLAQPQGLVRDLPNGWPDDWVGASNLPAVAGGRYVFAMGRLVELKGFQTLVAAMAKLRTRFPDVGLIVAGDGPYRAALLDQARRLGLDPLPALPAEGQPPGGVCFPGFVSGAVKRALIEHAAIGVCPSIREEPQGIVVLEMLCRGVPVLASHVGGLPDMIRPGVNGDLFRPADPDHLANKLAAALVQEDRLRAWARQAAPSVAHLRWSDVAERYLALFQEILAGRRLGAGQPASPHFQVSPARTAPASVVPHLAE